MLTCTTTAPLRDDNSIAPSLPVIVKTDTYTLVEGDVGREFAFNKATAVTCNLLAAATAGNGYDVVLRDMGAGALTIQPDGAETIGGESSAVIVQGRWVWIRCDGSNWDYVVGIGFQNPMTARGDLITGDAAGPGDPQRLAVGTNGQVLTSDGTDPGWGTVGTAGIADGSVTTAKIADNAVNGAKIAMGSDAQGDVLYYNGTDYARLGAGTSGHVLRTLGAGANPAWGQVTTDGIAASAVTGAKIAADTIDGTKISLTGEAAGSVAYFDGTDWKGLAAGTAGQHLESNGASAPTWGDASASPGWVHLLTATASVSATLDFTSNIDSTYDNYVFVFQDLYIDADDIISVRFSDDGGSTWEQGSTDYQSSAIAMRAKSTAWEGGITSTTDKLRLNGTNNFPGNKRLMAEIWLQSPSTSGINHGISGWISFFNTGANSWQQTMIQGYFSGNTNAIDGVRFFTESAGKEFTAGSISMFGIRIS